jgi:DNA-binding response OmpR family regulator
MKVLLVEDEELIAKGLKYTFKANGHEVDHTSCVKETIQYLYNNEPEFIVLDITLPDGNGVDLYNKYIAELEIPTLFLTAIDDEETVVKCLELGAEEYITKPFSEKELLARMKKIILRYKKNEVIKVKDIEFDISKMVVYKDGNQVTLTSLELT